MAGRIPIRVDTRVEIEVDGARVAAAMGMPEATFRQLMESGKITLLCERGVAEDSGLFRASFHFGNKRARLVIDREGRIVGEPESR
jgi:hypothetical protein